MDVLRSGKVVAFEEVRERFGRCSWRSPKVVNTLIVIEEDDVVEIQVLVAPHLLYMLSDHEQTMKWLTAVLRGGWDKVTTDVPNYPAPPPRAAKYSAPPTAVRPHAEHCRVPVGRRKDPNSYQAREVMAQAEFAQRGNKAHRRSS